MGRNGIAFDGIGAAFHPFELTHELVQKLGGAKEEPLCGKVLALVPGQHCVRTKVLTSCFREKAPGPAPMRPRRGMLRQENALSGMASD